MDVIFHRNCLDGVFSSFIAYLTTKLISQDELNLFVEEIKDAIATEGNDLTNYQPKNTPIIQENKMIEEQPPFVQLEQDFFHSLGGVSFNAYSFFAGEYYPLKFPNQAKVLLVLDTNLASAQNIKNACISHELVLIIDHHTSFADIREDVIAMEIKNLGFVFEEGRCAAAIAYHFLGKMLKFQRKLTPQYRSQLGRQLSYVSANDTKINQNKDSKAFVLGFYYFGIELSHTNPNLYKRIGTLDLQYLLSKGKNLYKDHLEQICEQVNHAKVAEFSSAGGNKMKGKRCLYLEPRNSNKISDIGIVLAYLSVESGMENLALLVMKKQEVRVSCRSHRKCKKEAIALEVAKLFEGGGHKEAAGFKISPNRMKSAFKLNGLGTCGIKVEMEIEDIEKIIFM